MWDEKKFFEDFSKETDQINPDEEFIKSLKTMTSEHVPAKRGPVWVRYGVVAAAVVARREPFAQRTVFIQTVQKRRDNGQSAAAERAAVQEPVFRAEYEQSD